MSDSDAGDIPHSVRLQDAREPLRCGAALEGVAPSEFIRRAIKERAQQMLGGGPICGVILRDWFAGQAMINRDGGTWYADTEEGNEKLLSMARACYRVADAMLAARGVAKPSPRHELEAMVLEKQGGA